MIEGIIGKKIGMTQIFDDDGNIVPVTAVKAGPCIVIQKKGKQKDGYEAVQVGLVEDKKIKLNKPIEGHLKKRKIKQPIKILKEFRIEKGAKVKEGAELKVDIFEKVNKVDVSGISKGKGFQGVIKRYHFSGGKKTHGSRFHRKPGSIGNSASPSRVFRGKKMPGQMGNKKATVLNLELVKIDKENNILLLKGAVPGSNGGTVIIKKSNFRRV